MSDSRIQQYFDSGTMTWVGDRYQYSSIFQQDRDNNVEIYEIIRVVIDVYGGKQWIQASVFFGQWPMSLSQMNEQKRSAVNHAFSQQFATFLILLDMHVPNQKIKCLLYKQQCQVKVRVKFTAKEKQHKKMMLEIDFKQIPLQKHLLKFEKDYGHLFPQLAQAYVFNNYMEHIFQKTSCLVLRGNETYSQDKNFLKAKYYYCVNKNCTLGQVRNQQRKVYKGVRIHPQILENQGNHIKIIRKNCAVKLIDIKKATNNNEEDENRRIASKEYRVTKLLNQMSKEKQLPGRNNIITILDTVQNLHQRYDIYEYCQCNLKTFLEQRRYQSTLNYSIIYQIMFQLAQVLKLIQEDLVCSQEETDRAYNALGSTQQERRQKARCFIHRDLKLQNIAVAFSSDNYVLVKVIDWQLAELIPRQQLSNMSRAGTIHNNAPQVCKQSINQKSDNWLLGVIFAKLFDKQVRQMDRKELLSFCTSTEFLKNIAQVKGLNEQLRTKIRGLVIGLLNESVFSRWPIYNALKCLRECQPDDMKKFQDRNKIYNTLEQLTFNHNLYGFQFFLQHPYRLYIDPPFVDYKTRILLTSRGLLKTYHWQGNTEINIDLFVYNTIINHNWHSKDLKPFQCTEANKKAAHLIFEELSKELSQLKQKYVIDIFGLVVENY